ncbi:DUF1380 family protein [Kosakonia sacchari]
MYGTVNALCAKLTEKYTPDEPLALIVWTKEDVLACLDEYGVTGDMAARIVGLIAGLDGVHECGVGLDTLICLLENLREEEARQREISVPAAALEKVMALAGEFLRMEEIQGGEGAAQRLYPDEASALRVLRKSLGR